MGSKKDNRMTPQRSLALGSVVFAVLWTLGMIWSTGTDVVNVVILSLTGTAVGILWYFGMRWWMRMMDRRKASSQ